MKAALEKRSDQGINRLSGSFRRHVRFFLKWDWLCSFFLNMEKVQSQMFSGQKVYTNKTVIKNI